MSSDTLSDDQKLLKKLKRRTRFTQFLAWLALFFTAVGIAAGYKNWLRIHERSKVNQVEISKINELAPTHAKKQQVALLQNEVNTHLTKNMEHLKGAMIELRNIQDSTQHIADSVYSQVETLTLQQEKNTTIQAPSIRDWSLAEVHFLLQTATQTFALNKDKDGAIKALTLADNILVKRGSTQLLPLRKQLSKDIALITQFALPNIELLSEKIDQLQNKLKPKEPTKKEVEEKQKSPITINLEETKESNKKAPKENDSLVNRVKKSFNDAVIVHKFDKPLRDEMDDQSKNTLYHLVSLRLETLRIMLLQKRDKSYHSQIKRIKALLKNYYPKEKYLLFEITLNQLDHVILTPPLPDISQSLQLLQSLMPATTQKEK